VFISQGVAPGNFTPEEFTCAVNIAAESCSLSRLGERHQVDDFTVSSVNRCSRPMTRGSSDQYRSFLATFSGTPEGRVTENGSRACTTTCSLVFFRIGAPGQDWSMRNAPLLTLSAPCRTQGSQPR
jgi:hypothetical protein